MIRNFLITVFYTAISFIASSQTIATFEIVLQKPANGINIPISVNLDEITFLSDSSLSLIELQGNKKIPTPFQISQGKQRTLYWLITPGNETNKKRTFQLVKSSPSPFPQISATMNDGALTIHSRDKKFLRYMYKTVYPPAGIDTAFKRSAFIHPLWAPHGQELTRIQAPDHYHHYGIWDPWTHVLFERDTVDFWNLKGRQGTVRFSNFVSVNSGSVYAEFAALHQHVVFKKDGTEKIALNELQTVRVYRPENDKDYYIADITIELNCAGESPFQILEYRYAGLGWRATEKWKKDNTEVLTSEGKTRKEADGSTARWCIIEGALDNDYGGAVMMSYPGNYNHPEPLRIWPEDANNGEMFGMFAPTKNKNWLLEPGKTYTLKYRFVVFNGHFNKEKAESAWQYFAMPPKVKIIK
jgi:Methane oxygenase PmoA